MGDLMGFPNLSDRKTHLTLIRIYMYGGIVVVEENKTIF